MICTKKIAVLIFAGLAIGLFSTRAAWSQPRRDPLPRDDVVHKFAESDDPARQ